MKWNPLIPFLLIAVLGIGLTFFLSVKKDLMTLGRLQAEEKANLLKRKMQTLHQKKFTRQTASHATVKIMKAFRVRA